MLLLIWLLIPGITSRENKEIFTGHEVTFTEHGIVTSIERISESSDTLYISHDKVVNFDKKAFNNVQHLKNLTAEIRSTITQLSPFVFLQLKNLEFLHIIRSSSIRTKKAFVGLTNLKTLIVTTGIEEIGLPWDRMDFIGLPRTTNITIGSQPINNSVTPLDEELQPYRLVCINEKNYVTSLKRVDDLDELRTAARKCDRFHVIDNDEFESSNRINLQHMSIRGFELDWFDLDVDGRDVTLDLSYNHIHAIQAEMLNHLPPSNWTVNLRKNYLTDLRKGYIFNENLVRLILSKNSIKEIEEHALENTSLRRLDVSENQLNDDKFVETLPPFMMMLHLNDNNITTLWPNAFLRLKELKVLHLHRNKLENLKNDVFKGLQELHNFSIDRKKLRNITHDSFDGLPDAIIRCLNKNGSGCTNDHK